MHTYRRSFIHSVLREGLLRAFASSLRRFGGTQNVPLAAAPIDHLCIPLDSRRVHVPCCWVLACCIRYIPVAVVSLPVALCLRANSSLLSLEMSAILSRALRSCNTYVPRRLFFTFAPKVVIPEDPTSKPSVLLKLLGLYSKDSVLPRQAKKLYTAAKEQARSLFL